MKNTQKADRDQNLFASFLDRVQTIHKKYQNPFTTF